MGQLAHYYPAATRRHRVANDDIETGTLITEDRVTQHRDLGATQWFTVKASQREAGHSAWEHTGLPAYATVLDGRVAFAWRAMDAFYEEEERIFGHAADAYHRIDIRSTTRYLVVRDGDRMIADTHRPLALYESGFAPRWYVPREDIDESALKLVGIQTFCPYKGICSYYDIGGHQHVAWSYLGAWTEVARVRDLASFEVVILPVADPERSLRFYRDQVGFQLDVDYAPTPEFRVIQLTPGGSGTSIQFGSGLTDAPTGSMRGLYLVVSDIEVSRAELTGHGVTVSAIRHKDTDGGWSVGFRGALITRRGNAPLPVHGLPQPDIVVGDLRELAERLGSR